MAKKPTAAEKKAAKQAEANAKAAATAGAGRNLLAEAVNARNTNTPLMATMAEMGYLLNDPRGPLVEHNMNIVQGDKVAFRASELGVNVLANPTAPAQAPAPAAWGGGTPGATAPVPQAQAQAPGPAPAATGSKSFAFDAGIDIPAPRRGGRGSTVYGFEQMNVGQSFFIPATTDNANPAKRIASTVSSASARLAPKKFIVRSVDETAQGRGKGARVWRTADEPA